MRLDRRLHELFPGASGRAIKQWLELGRVRVAGHVVRRGDVAVGSADRVELGPPPGPSFPPLLRLVFEDDDILVIDKPPGLLTIATERERDRTAYRLLADYVGGHRAPADKARRGGPRLFIVHRLDRETSGLIVFAKSSDAKRRLQSQFEARGVDRLYVALVEGIVTDARGRLRSRLREGRAPRVRQTRSALRAARRSPTTACSSTATARRSSSCPSSQAAVARSAPSSPLWATRSSAIMPMEPVTTLSAGSACTPRDWPSAIPTATGSPSIARPLPPSPASAASAAHEADR